MPGPSNSVLLSFLLLDNQRGILLVLFFGFFGHTLQHAGSQFSYQRLNLCALQWEHRVLTIGQPGKPHCSHFTLTYSEPRFLGYDLE